MLPENAFSGCHVTLSLDDFQGMIEALALLRSVKPHMSTTGLHGCIDLPNAQDAWWLLAELFQLG